MTTDTGDCIQVRESNGYYEIVPNAEPECWTDVLAQADKHDRVEKLVGWGKYTAAYRLTVDDCEVWYFVEE